MTYTDLDNLIKDYLPEAKSISEKSALARILESVCTFVDTYTKRPSGYFSPALPAPSTIRVRGEGKHFLRLPVHIFGTAEIVNYPANTNGYYESNVNGWLYYENSNADLDDDDLYVNGVSSNFYSQRIFPEGKVYMVSARWGYEVIPLDIQEAVRETVARIWETQKGTLGQVTPNGFVIERALPLLAREILDKYKRKEFEIAGVGGTVPTLPIPVPTPETVTDVWVTEWMQNAIYGENLSANVGLSALGIYRKNLSQTNDQIQVKIPQNTAGIFFVLIWESNLFQQFVTYNPVDGDKALTVKNLGDYVFQAEVDGQTQIYDAKPQLNLESPPQMYLGVWALFEPLSIEKFVNA